MDIKSGPHLATHMHQLMSSFVRVKLPNAQHVSRILRFNVRSYQNVVKKKQNQWEASGAMLRRPSAPQWSIIFMILHPQWSAPQWKFLIFSWFCIIFMIFSWKIKKNTTFFAFYLESSKNVLALISLITPGNERNTSQVCPRSHPSVLEKFSWKISRSVGYAVEPQNPAQPKSVHKFINRDARSLLVR